MKAKKNARREAYAAKQEKQGRRVVEWIIGVLVLLAVAIPFGFFPFTNTYSSGLIMPNFGDDFSRGLYLRGLG